MAATAIVLYSFTETYWSNEEPPPLEIERVAAPPAQQIDSRQMAPGSSPNRPPAGTVVDPETGLPAPTRDESGMPVFPSGNRQGSAPSGADSRTGQNPRIFSTQPSSPSGSQPMPRWNADRSAPPGAESDPGTSAPIRTRQPTRAPSGQTVFPGAESQKRQESQDPSPPPVRSSMPNQRPRR